MIMESWLKIYRKFLDWEWFDKPEMVQLFLYLLLSANHENKKWNGIAIKKGQLVTSLDSIHRKTSLSVRTIRTCIERLKTTNEITSKTTNKYTLITICNYDSYQQKEIYNDKQNNKQNDKRPTIKRQSNDKRPTTNKNNKNINTIVFIKEKYKENFSFDFVESDFEQVFFDWMEYKHQRKEMYKTQKSLGLCYKKLKEYSDGNSETAKTIIEKSMASNWAGFFEIKPQKTNNQSATQNVNDEWEK